MKPSTARKRVVKSPEDRRRELLDAALRTLAEKGLAEATVADISREAGVAKGTFYLYFDSKDHLLASLRERFVEELMTQAQTLNERVGKEDWWALAESSVESMIDFMLDHKDAMKVFALEVVRPETHDILAECERRLNEMLAAGIRAGVEAGAFRVSDSTMAASFLHHAINGAVLEAILYGGDVDRERLVRAAQELLHKMLSP